MKICFKKYNPYLISCLFLGIGNFFSLNHLFGQNNNLNFTLSDSIKRQPAKPLDTILYRLEISGTDNNDINSLIINRKGDANTTYISGSFQSNALALPGNIQTALEDQATTILLQGLDPDGDDLTFSLISQPSHGVLSALSKQGKTAASITFQPDENFEGTDEFKFLVEDDDNNKDTAIVTLKIQSVNDAPSFDIGENIDLLEDAAAQTFANWAKNISRGTSNEANQSVNFKVLNNTNPALFVSPPIVSENGSLTFQTQNNANGVVMIDLQLEDNGGVDNGGVDTSARQSFIITIQPVNDAPTFAKGSDITLKTDSMPQTFENWAKDITSGPSDEAEQMITFVIENNDNVTLFSELPRVSPSGVLTFKAVEGAVGIANISIKLMDDGGVANGGVDSSGIQTFKITLEPIE